MRIIFHLILLVPQNNVMDLNNVTYNEIITLFYGTDNILHNIPPFRPNVGNFAQNIVSPAKHCYGSE